MRAASSGDDFISDEFMCVHQYLDHVFVSHERCAAQWCDLIIVHRVRVRFAFGQQQLNDRRAATQGRQKEGPLTDAVDTGYMSMEKW